MTEQKAIERLKCMELFMQINDKDNESKFLDEDYEANAMAIKSLEKQIPIMVADDGMRIPFSYYCPICKEELSDDGYKDEDIKYCPNCGQALEWE